MDFIPEDAVGVIRFDEEGDGVTDGWVPTTFANSLMCQTLSKAYSTSGEAQQNRNCIVLFLDDI